MFKRAKDILRSVYCGIFKRNKYGAEIAFWKSRWEADKGTFRNSHFRKIMLAMAEEENENFLQSKIVADFGCGPRGSLAWASSASARIGIDVLADTYADCFKASVLSHGMIYVKATEKTIPLPSSYVDVLFTLNAMDHVENFEEMCEEILRIIKPGGDFIGGFNLEEPSSPTEPQRLTEERIKSNLLDYLEIKSYRTARQGPDGGVSNLGQNYCNFFNQNFDYKQGDRGYLWVRARKPNA